MNHRERFHRIFEFKEIDRICDYEFGYWDETIDRWHREGLPSNYRDNSSVEKYLDLEGYDCLEFLPVKTGLWPKPPARMTAFIFTSLLYTKRPLKNSFLPFLQIVIQWFRLSRVIMEFYKSLSDKPDLD